MLKNNIVFIIILLLNITTFALTCSENNNQICDSSCKSCSRPCDPDACTSCFPRHFKLSLEYQDSEFQCSNKCSQNFSLPINGQRFRYCNISKPIKIKELKNDENENVEIVRTKFIETSESESSKMMFIVFGVGVGGGILVIIALTILIRFKKLLLPRHYSSKEKLLQKESEVEAEGGNSNTNNKFDRNYLKIAGSTQKYSQLTIITNINEILIGQEISGGHFSKVYKGKFRNQNVAIKIAGENGRKSIYTELKIYDKICHKNILPAFAVYFGVKNMLLMPLRNRNLTKHFLLNSNKITVSQLLQYSIQVADAMAYLHFNKIIHCDLKIDNILIKDLTGKNIEIIDFGFAVDLSDEISPHFHGSTTHAAYEILKAYIRFETNNTEFTTEVLCSKKSDVWAFAITVWQIFQKSSKIPENFRAPKDIVKNYENGKKLEQPSKMPDYIWRYIIIKCVDLEPKTRPKMSEILESLKIYQQKNNPNI